MINLVSRAPHSIVKVVGQSIYQTYCGLLTGAFSRFDPTTAVAYGAVWAADNGCFLPGYNPDAILSMLRSYQGIKGCKWVVMPDVVRDASATMLTTETNIAVTTVLISVCLLLVLFNHADALGSPFGVFCGWFAAEIIKSRSNNHD